NGSLEAQVLLDELRSRANSRLAEFEPNVFDAPREFEGKPRAVAGPDGRAAVAPHVDALAEAEAAADLPLDPPLRHLPAVEKEAQRCLTSRPRGCVADEVEADLHPAPRHGGLDDHVVALDVAEVVVVARPILPVDERKPGAVTARGKDHALRALL